MSGSDDPATTTAGRGPRPRSVTVAAVLVGLGALLSAAAAVLHVVASVFLRPAPLQDRPAIRAGRA